MVHRLQIASPVCPTGLYVVGLVPSMEYTQKYALERGLVEVTLVEGKEEVIRNFLFHSSFSL